MDKKKIFLFGNSKSETSTLIAEMFNALGFDVINLNKECFLNNRETKIEFTDADLVFVDVNKFNPKVVSVLKKLRKICQNKPLLISSASYQHEFFSSFTDDQYATFIAKPFDLEKLNWVINRYRV